MKALFGRILLSCVKAVPLARIQNKKGEWSDYTIGHAVHEAAAMHLITQAKLAKLSVAATEAKNIAASAKGAAAAAMSKADIHANKMQANLVKHENKLIELRSSISTSTQLHGAHIAALYVTDKRLTALEPKPVATKPVASKKAPVRAVKSAKRGRK